MTIVVWQDYKRATRLDEWSVGQGRNEADWNHNYGLKWTKSNSFAHILPVSEQHKSEIMLLNQIHIRHFPKC